MKTNHSRKCLLDQRIVIQLNFRVLVFLGLVMLVQVPAISTAQAQDEKGRASSSSKSRPPVTTKNSRKKPRNYETVDPCAEEVADASLTLGPGVPGDQATSDGIQYFLGDPFPSQAHCGLFLVDITVPSNSSASGFLPSFSIESGAVDLKTAYPSVKNASSGTNYAGGFAVPNYDGCPVYHQETRIFVRNARSMKFTLLRSVIAQGKRDQSTPYDPTKKCFLVPDPDPGKGMLSYGLPFGAQPSKSGTKVYRVAVKVSLGSVSNWGGENRQQVRVKASHDADIK